MSDLPNQPILNVPQPSCGRGVQRLLPIFPSESTNIAEGLAVLWTDGNVKYFTGVTPVFTHKEKDEASFRMFTAQLCAQGTCKQMDIVRAFGVSKRSLIRWVEQFREGGTESFYGGRKASPHVKRVWTKENVEQAQELLNDGATPPEVARRMGLKEDTVRKAVKHGVLMRPSHKSPKVSSGSAKGERSARDAQPLAGRACHDTQGRVAAANGLLVEGASRVFTSAADVPNAGALCALPALLENGLLHGVEANFVLPPGFYPVMTYFLLVSFMFMTRTGPPEQLRYNEPGEWGLLLGHDRSPEVKTLRAKLEALAQPPHVSIWAAGLAMHWMKDDPTLAGVLYVDGHVRLYHGSQTKLPPRFVSRQRLCLRSVMDYWVNDQEGRPFFVLTAVDTEGILAHLRSDLIPRLISEVPGQPSAAELSSEKDLHRFDIIVDREGFSPRAMTEVFREHRVAITTYRRHPYQAWDTDEFVSTPVPLAHGNQQDMLLASRPFGNEGSGLREIRRLTSHGTQTAIVTSNRVTPMARIAGSMFSRWCQENYFRYASQQFGIDRLAGYSLDAPPVTTTLVNPAWRTSDAEVRRLRSDLTRRCAERGSIVLPPNANERTLAAYQQRMGELNEAINAITEKLVSARAARKKEPKRIPLDQIPEADRPHLVSPHRKQLIDTLGMIAYRAETAQVLILRDHMARDEDARTLAQTLYRTTGDLIVDSGMNTLTVRLHRGASNLADKAVAGLLEVLNTAEAIYPGTNLRMLYELVTL